MQFKEACFQFDRRVVYNPIRNPTKLPIRQSSSILIRIPMPTNSQADSETQYQLPPSEVVEIIDAPLEPGINFSPDTQWMLLVQRPAMPSLEDISRRMLQLGGIRIDPAANARFETDFATKLSIRTRDDEEETTIPLPDGAKPQWHIVESSIQSLHLFNRDRSRSAALVRRSRRPASPHMLTDQLSTIVGGLRWMPDAQHLLCRLVPTDRGKEPTADKTPTGPNIQESIEHTSPTRTYQDL